MSLHFSEHVLTIRLIACMAQVHLLDPFTSQTSSYYAHAYVFSIINPPPFARAYIATEAAPDDEADGSSARGVGGCRARPLQVVEAEHGDESVTPWRGGAQPAAGLVPVQCSRMACAASIRCSAWSATCVGATSANLSARRDGFMHA